MELTAAQLAERLGLGVHGDPSARVSGVATLARATPSDLAFLANPRYRSQLAGSRAGIVVMRAEDAEGGPKAFAFFVPFVAMAQGDWGLSTSIVLLPAKNS